MRRALTLCLLLACNGGDDTDTDTTGDPAGYDGPSSIDDYDEPACAESTWRYGFDIIGWAPTATITIARTTGEAYSEVHTLPSAGYDDFGYWDRLERSLAIVETPAQKADESTAFTCGDLATMTFLVRIWDHTEALADCIAWGDDPAFFLGQEDYAACNDASDWHSGQ